MVFELPVDPDQLANHLRTRGAEGRTGATAQKRIAESRHSRFRGQSLRGGATTRGQRRSRSSSR